MHTEQIKSADSNLTVQIYVTHLCTACTVGKRQGRVLVDCCCVTLFYAKYLWNSFMPNMLSRISDLLLINWYTTAFHYLNYSTRRFVRYFMLYISIDSVIWIIQFADLFFVSRERYFNWKYIRISNKLFGSVSMMCREYKLHCQFYCFLCTSRFAASFDSLTAALHVLI